MRIDQLLLETLLKEKEPVSMDALAFELGISKKTVIKYMNLLREVLEDNGASLTTKQRVGSYIEIHDQEQFQSFLNHFNSNTFLDDPVLRKRYVLTRMILSENFIDIYELADEICISPSLLRSIFKELSPVLEKYNLKMAHAHFHGYKITGEEMDIRRCLVRECKESSSIANTISKNRFKANEKDIIHRIIAETLEQLSISVSSQSISSLTLHAMIAINRLETGNPIILEDVYSTNKIKGKPEFFAAAEINRQLKSRLNIDLPESELVYLTMHICGQQRLYGHRIPSIQIDNHALLFYNQFLRNIWQLADEDFFSDDDLRESLLNHIVPFLNRIEHNMQIEKTELSNIKNEYPYAYDLSVTGLSILESNSVYVTEAEISYFALHLQLSLEKRKLGSEVKYNVLVFSNETSSVFHMISYKLEHTFGDKINEIVFSSQQDRSAFDISEFQIILNTTNSRDSIPDTAIQVSPYLNDSDMAVIEQAFSKISSRIINTIMLHDYLFYDLDCASKEEVLKVMTERIRKYITIPDDFIERIEKREVLAGTDYENRLAIPHPLDNTGIPEFICVARLSHPVKWNTKSVQLVFLICNNGDINPWFYSKLAKIISDSTLTQSLIKADGFDSFKTIFETI